LNNKGSHGTDDYILEENNELIKDPEKVGDIFIDYYTNIVEHETGNPPINIPIPEDGDIIDTILSHYKDHESILAIENMAFTQTFTLPPATEEEIEDNINKLNTSKATGADNIPARLIKLSVMAIKKQLTSILNNDIKKRKFPDLLKIGKITPSYKNSKDSNRLDKKHNRPVSVLTAFSKIYERYILSKMLSHVNLILSDKISAYRKDYSCQYVLLKLTEE
jgi:hypothetical protein